MTQPFFAMGIMSLLFGSKPAALPAELSLPVDLATFTCGRTVLGERPKPDEPYAKHFDRNGVANCEKSGVELGTENGVLDYAFITVRNFKGTLLKSGDEISLSPKTTIDEILPLFGEPYWKSTDDGETILFYEFKEGRIELQFEFPDKRHLGFITLVRDGVLSKADQRKAYGVKKDWPPKE
jgi:hypothetical protein